MPLLEQVLEQYPNQVKVAFKHFPLRNHKFARSAAAASLAANEQGKFWEFHDELFENYNKLNEQKIRDIAVELGLDMERFDKSVKDRTLLAQINRDMVEAQKVEVRGTPTIFINGRLLKNRSLPGFSEIIENELTKTKQANQ